LAAEYGPETFSLYEPVPGRTTPPRLAPAPTAPPRSDQTVPEQRLAAGEPLAQHKPSRNAVGLKLSIVMAAYNEAETILEAIEEVLAVDYPCEMELIVVDDGSKDETPALLAKLDDDRVRVLSHEVNQGKGAAVRTAMAAANGTHILPFDADLEYVPDDILRLLEPVLRGRCNVVYGVRLFGINTVYRSFLYAAGNRTFTRTANLLFGACLSDLHTCLKLVPIDVLRALRLIETGFGLDTEISASLLRCGIRPFEVPVSYFSRSHEEGKKISWRDAFACLRILLRIRARRRAYFRDAIDFARVHRRASSVLPAAAAEPWQAPAVLVSEPVGEMSLRTTR
jgi:dolichol-phosphate hexosyltransferase